MVELAYCAYPSSVLSYQLNSGLRAAGLRQQGFLPGHDHHPAHAKAVGHHAKRGGKKCGPEGHLNLAAVGQGVEQALGFGVGGGGDREREAFEQSL